MSSLLDLFGRYWLEVAPILILPWIVATVVLFIFAATHDWRALSLWQRRYVTVAAIVLPLFVFYVLLHWFDRLTSASYFYSLWLMVLIVLVCLIEWTGIAIGLILLVKMSSEILKKINARSQLNSR
jgi:hypothetical protein